MDLQNTLVSQAYALGKNAAAPVADSGNSFTGKLAEGASAFEKILTTSEQASRGALLGDVTPHALVQALSSSEMAVDTVVTIRDKVVEAYQEIMRMPV